jgi:septal ring factor EnvC (AmiA/AmiB activator)
VAEKRRQDDSLTYILKILGGVSALTVLVSSLCVVVINYGIAMGEQREVNKTTSHQIEENKKENKEQEKRIQKNEQEIARINDKLDILIKSVGNIDEKLDSK